MHHVAIVLAAGQGTRMRSALPKVLHPLVGRPMIDWVLDAVAETKPERTIVVVGHGGEHVAQTLPDWVEVAVQAEQKGTGHAVQVALDHIGSLRRDGSVLVLPGDTPLVDGATLSDLLRTHTESEADLTLLTTELIDPTGYGRVVRGDDRGVVAIVEDQDADDAIRAIREVNAGMYVFRAEGLTADLEEIEPHNKQGEYYLPDVVSMAVARDDRVAAVVAPAEVVSGVNTHGHLAAAASVLRGRLTEKWLAAGVRMIDPGRVYLDFDVQLEAGVILYPGVHLERGTHVEAGATVGPDVYATGSVIRAGARVWYAVLREAEIGEECEVGPFASLRPGTVLKRKAKAGTFVEMKKSVVGEGSKVPHLTYLGDATVGAGSNIGAGTITCNYDGFGKHPTTIGDGVFIGSDTMLVAPVTVHDGAMTAAGSTITSDVETGALGVARGRQRNIPGFVERLASRYRASGAEEAPSE